MYGLPAKIYLASKSPRRRELLKQIGVQFDVILLREGASRAQDVDEDPLPGEAPRDYVQRVCALKAAAGWSRLMQRNLRHYPLLAADTTVAVGNTILGKPTSPADAVTMLKLLAGREHEVFTAVAVQHEGRGTAALSASRVRFADLSDAQINAYVATNEGIDKAGGYAIQGQAAGFVIELNGSYSGVMGLPLYETAQLLRECVPRP